MGAGVRRSNPNPRALTSSAFHKEGLWLHAQAPRAARGTSLGRSAAGSHGGDWVKLDDDRGPPDTPRAPTSWHDFDSLGPRGTPPVTLNRGCLNHHGTPGYVSPCLWGPLPDRKILGVQGVHGGLGWSQLTSYQTQKPCLLHCPWEHS